MLSLIPLALAATLGVSATPTPPASNPISVALCEVIPADSISLDAPTPRGIGAIDISFMNHAAVAAKDVTFVIRYAGATQTIDDRGTSRRTSLSSMASWRTSTATATGPPAPLRR